MKQELNKKKKKDKPKKITRLDGEQRFYEVDGVKYPSVTTILGVINKPFLVNWAKKIVTENLRPIFIAIKNGDLTLKEIDIDLILTTAKENPKKIMEEAGDIGTQVHRHLEEIVKREIENPQKFSWIEHRDYWLTIIETNKPDDRVISCVNAFFVWANDNHFRPIESELMVYSKSIGYAGTLDTAGYVNNVLSVIDFKSSNAYHEDMAIQISAYRHAYAEMRKEKKTNGMFILRLGKIEGDFEAISITEPAKNLIAFKSALTLWKWKQNNNNKK